MGRPEKNREGAYNKAFPARLRKTLEEKKYTQSMLANFLGITRQSVGRYCDGTSSPDWETLVNIAKQLKVSTDYLLGLSEEAKPDISIQAIKSKTGLGNDAIKQLKKMDAEEREMTNSIISHPDFANVLSCLKNARHFAACENLPFGIAEADYQNARNQLRSDCCEVLSSSEAIEYYTRKANKKMEEILEAIKEG